MPSGNSPTTTTPLPTGSASNKSVITSSISRTTASSPRHHLHPASEDIPSEPSRVHSSTLPIRRTPARQGGQPVDE